MKQAVSEKMKVGRDRTELAQKLPLKMHEMHEIKNENGGK